MIGDIIIKGHPILEERLKEIKSIDANIIEKAEIMIDIMLSRTAAGVAANQVGYSERMFVFQIVGDRAGAIEIKPTIVINPKIEYMSEEQEIDWEGCLSLPNLIGKVKRSKHIKYSYLDTSGVKKIEEAEGFYARVIQHEVNHLNGLIYLDTMNSFREFCYRSEIEKHKQYYI